MLGAQELTGVLPAVIRGLYGYDPEEVAWESARAIVYRGRRKIDGLPVLIRLLREPMSGGWGADWFQRDYQIAHHLRSQCVARPLAFEQTDRGPALIYADEGYRPLEALSDPDIERILKVGANLAEGVSALHKERLTHCNLNAASVWLNDKTGSILISDYGCARYASEAVVRGMPPCDDLIDVRYMSPEQTGRVQNIVDQRTDIYSMGIILYQLLTGRGPFDDGDPLNVIDGHVTRPPSFPNELLGTLSGGLMKVIAKALAKNPDARYLSAGGLAADLLACHALWTANGSLDTFEPGISDAKGMLRISRRLYGRDREIATLTEEVKSAQAGRPALLLVKGAPGVGKSSLLGELETLVRHENGRFVSGKFDQYKRNIPYLALIGALQQLVGQLLGETKEQLEASRSRILAALGNSAQIVIDVIPELELITGPQPAVPSVPPIQARNRFNHVFTKLLQALVPHNQLLTLVMDDLQWVDAASLGLLSHVLTDPETMNILFAGAYRSNEVDPDHPLEAMIKSLTEARSRVQVLDLSELNETDLRQLVRDTFTLPAAEVPDLARVLFEKSGGNPFYLTQFLPYLCDAGLITFDYRNGRWTWDLPAIQQEGVTQDVLELLNARFATLHEDTRTVLAAAACIGSTFEVGRLAAACGRPLTEVLQCTMIGVREGLIIKVADSHAVLHSGQESDHRDTGSYRFLHDRIQEAAFDCIPDDAKKAFRLHIGRRLMIGLIPDDELAPPLDVLSNLNYGWDLMTDDAEKQRVARLNLVAGRRARKALAYQDALGFLSVGRGLLPKKAWRTTYDLAFELHSEAFECEYLTANFERAGQFFKTLIANAHSKVDKARVYRIKIMLDTSEERYEEAFRIGITSLKLFGVRLLRRPSKLAILTQLLMVRWRMRGRQPQELLAAKELDNIEKMAALRLLVALIPTAYFLSPDAFTFTALRVVNYSLRHGISPISAPGFVIYGVALGVGMDDFRRGNEFGRFALELAERSKDPSIICKVLWIFAGMIKPWRDRLDELYPLADRARKLALDAGDLQYATYSRSSDFFPRIVSRGSSLLEALNICEEHRPYIEHSKDVMMVEMLTMGENCALALQGKTTAPYSLNCGSYDECAAELRYRRTGNLTLAFFQILIRLQLACLFGRYEDVLSLSDKGEEVVRSGSGFTQVADLYFFRGLAAVIALTRQIGNAARHRRTLRYCLKRLHVFAINSPHNFCQHEALLEAEAARVEGGRKDVLKLYNRAIDVAEAEGYTHLVGLSNERAALFCLADGQRRLAGWYLSCARAAYDKWGATAKVAQLDRDYADLLPAPVSSSREPVSASRTAAHQGERFDIAAALQASRIISSGENTERVLTHLMQLIRIQAGAESAQLLIWEGGRLRLEASATVESGGVLLFPTQSAEAGQESYSPAIVNYVLHTGHELMLGEAGTDARFAQCSYMRNRQPKSVLCSAIRHQGELLGVIYLEHTQIAGTFDGQKLEWLRLLSTEVGLAVWSARLSRYREYVHKFAPAAVAKEIDANPVSPNLAAKDTDVSILFGDLAGYTRMAEQLERRQLDEFINRAFSRFTDEIHRHEGVLLEIRGDELFVLFSDEDPSRHVWKAVHAALAISRVAASLKDELSSAYPPLIMNMGINCGVASVGLKAVDAASGSRWRYGASGTVVNVAARVRELARDGSILVSADAASRVSNDFVFEDMGEHSLKNVQNPVHIYRLTGGQEASQYH